MIKNKINAIGFNMMNKINSNKVTIAPPKTKNKIKPRKIQTIIIGATLVEKDDLL